MFILMMGGFFLPAQIQVRNEVDIEAVPAQIYPLVASQNEWTTWSIWSQKVDESIVFNNSHQDTLSWNSQHAGRGMLLITPLLQNSEIRTLLVLQDGKFELPGILRLQVVNENTTRVIWENTIHLGNNPIKRYIGKSVENVVHRDLSFCLEGLKAKISTSANQRNISP